MRGTCAGEIGQTQFLAENCLKHAVDFDGNGKRDLISSEADVLTSTADFLSIHGWQPGAGHRPGEASYGLFAAWNCAVVYQQGLSLFASRIAD